MERPARSQVSLLQGPPASTPTAEAGRRRYGLPGSSRQARAGASPPGPTCSGSGGNPTPARTVASPPPRSWMTEDTVASTCSECGTIFRYDPELFRQQLPPRICRSCHFQRRQRLVVTAGIVESVGGIGATLRNETTNARFFWSWRRSGSVPQPGQRYRFAYDPLERPQSGRLPIARGVRLLDASR